jgi:hypothetical protein
MAMHLSRSGWALTVLSAALVALVVPDAARLADDLGSDSLPAALVAAASLIVLVLAGWSLLTASVVLLGGSSRLVAAIAPPMLRHTLIAGAAVALVTAPAHAEQLSAPQPRQHTLEGLRLPDRPNDVQSTVPHREPASEPASEAASEPTEAVVQVRRGDTLWAIAARSLPADATPREIARATQRWHATNRDVIGDDPDRIFPTQRLTPPTGKDHP